MDFKEVSKLKPNPLNPRGAVVVDDALRQLADSIASQGVLQPILVTPDGVIVAGHRRHKACELLGGHLIPVIVRELTEAQQIEVMLVENLQRADLTPLQMAKAYRALMDRGLSVQLISQAIGTTKRQISEHLGILKLPECLHPHFDGGALTIRCVPILLKLSVEEQSRVGLEAAEKKWGSIKLAGVVWRMQNPKSVTAIVPNMLDRIWERVEDGCYTIESVMKCGECGNDVFGMTREEIQTYLQALVDRGMAEWRDQGGETEAAKGPAQKLCVPRDLPSGDIFALGRGTASDEADEWAA